MDIQSIQKFVINLPERGDRLEQLEEELTCLFYEPSYILMNGVKRPLVHEGIAEAHIQCVRMAKALNLPYCMIIEDDLLFQAKEKTIEYVTNAFRHVPEDWDILLSGIYDGHPVKVNEYWSKVKKFCGLHLYVVNAKFYDKFLSYEGGWHIDQWLNHKGDNNVYVTNKFFAIQRNGYSDNVKKNVNYNDLLKNYKIL